LYLITEADNLIPGSFRLHTFYFSVLYFITDADNFIPGSFRLHKSVNIALLLSSLGCLQNIF